MQKVLQITQSLQTFPLILHTVSSKTVRSHSEVNQFLTYRLAKQPDQLALCFKGVCMLCVYLDHLSHVAFWAGVFSGIFNFYQDDKEQIVPHVVLLFNVLLKGHRLVVKLVTLQTCHEENSMNRGHSVFWKNKASMFLAVL